MNKLRGTVTTGIVLTKDCFTCVLSNTVSYNFP